MKRKIFFSKHLLKAELSSLSAQTKLMPLRYKLALAQALLLLFLLTNSTASKAQVAPEDTLSPEVAIEEGVKIEEDVKIAEALELLIDSMKMKKFTYESVGRPDPFEPFISDKVMQEVAETKPEVLTGMRQFEPGQLSLVAIIFTADSPMAMVEDSSHKGYIVRKGTKIGRSGIISDILPNQVIIKQLSYSMTKEKKYNTVEMTLRKEGEK
jgi:type IV pilus assembly protein PilP